MRNCIACGVSFAPIKHNQIYCSTKCRKLIKRRQQRLICQKYGLCPQWGGAMDYPVRVGSAKVVGKTKVSYCSKCRERFKKTTAAPISG